MNQIPNPKSHSPGPIAQSRKRKSWTVGLWLLGFGICLSGCGVNASPSLAHASPSPEMLAETVLAAMRDGDVAQLERVALTEEEFRAHVWPELPASRPGRNVPFEFVWDRLAQNSRNHLRQTLGSLEDRPLTLRSVEFAGETTVYGDVTVHRDTQLVVAGSDGSEQVIEIYGATIEQNGGYKVFSYVVD